MTRAEEEARDAAHLQYCVASAIRRPLPVEDWLADVSKRSKQLEELLRNPPLDHYQMCPGGPARLEKLRLSVDAELKTRKRWQLKRQPAPTPDPALAVLVGKLRDIFEEFHEPVLIREINGTLSGRFIDYALEYAKEYGVDIKPGTIDRYLRPLFPRDR